MKRSAGTPPRQRSPRSPHRSPRPRPGGATGTTSGSSTCVPKQPRHRARRGTSSRSPDRQRNTRSRACPHGPNTSRHDGHASSPSASSASTLASSAHTINIGVPPPASKRALPTTINQTGGLSRVHERAKRVNPSDRPARRSTARTLPRVPKSSFVQQATRIREYQADPRRAQQPGPPPTQPTPTQPDTPNAKCEKSLRPP